VLYDGVMYDPIKGRGQGRGHGGPKVAKIANFNVHLLHWYVM